VQARPATPCGLVPTPPASPPRLSLLSTQAAAPTWACSAALLLLAACARLCFTTAAVAVALLLLVRVASAWLEAFQAWLEDFWERRKARAGAFGVPLQSCMPRHHALGRNSCAPSDPLPTPSLLVHTR
jgi:hypothetical protein